LLSIGFASPVHGLFGLESFNFSQHIAPLGLGPLRLELLLFKKVGVFLELVDLLLDGFHVDVVHTCFMCQKSDLRLLRGMEVH